MVFGAGGAVGCGAGGAVGAGGGGAGGCGGGGGGGAVGGGALGCTGAEVGGATGGFEGLAAAGGCAAPPEADDVSPPVQAGGGGADGADGAAVVGCAGAAGAGALGFAAAVPALAGGGGGALAVPPLLVGAGAPPLAAAGALPSPLEALRAMAAGGGALGFVARTASLVAAASAVAATGWPLASTAAGCSISTQSCVTGSQRQPSCSMTWSACTCSDAAVSLFHFGAGAVRATPAHREANMPTAPTPVITRVARNRVRFFATLIIFVLVLVLRLFPVPAVVIASWPRRSARYGPG